MIQKGKPFVIDMRGNPGGDLQNGLEMARLLFGLKNVNLVPTAQKIIYRKQTPEALSVLANAFWLQKQKYESQNLIPPPYLLSQYNSQVAWYHKALQGQIPSLQIVETGNVQLDLSHAFPAPIYILVDRNCGSSCELTLEALERHPQVFTIGEHTTGIIHFGNVGQVYLPQSHVVINIPTQGSIYQDGRQVEKIGSAPKHPVPSGSDALDFTLEKFF